MKKVVFIFTAIAYYLINLNNLFSQVPDCPPNEDWIPEYAIYLIEYNGISCETEVFYCYKTVNNQRYNYIRQVTMLDNDCLTPGTDLSSKIIWDQIVTNVFIDQTEAAQWDDKYLVVPPCPSTFTNIVVQKKSCWFWLNLGESTYLMPCENSEYDCFTYFTVCYNYNVALPQLIVQQVGGLTILCDINKGDWSPFLTQSQCWSTCY